MAPQQFEKAQTFHVDSFEHYFLEFNFNQKSMLFLFKFGDEGIASYKSFALKSEQRNI